MQRASFTLPHIDFLYFCLKTVQVEPKYFGFSARLRLPLEALLRPWQATEWPFKQKTQLPIVGLGLKMPYKVLKM